MHRNTSVLVWIPDNKENLASNDFWISITRDSISVTAIREGEVNFREYESFSTLCDDLHIREMANKPSGD